MYKKMKAYAKQTTKATANMENNKNTVVVLKDKEMEKVYGGYGGSNLVLTVMHCFACDYNTWWKGNYVGEVYDCPQCGKHEFRGAKIKD